MPPTPVFYVANYSNPKNHMVFLFQEQFTVSRKLQASAFFRIDYLTMFS